MMKNTVETYTSLETAIKDVLENQGETWPQPVIYFEDGKFGACNAPALSGNEIVWMHIEGEHEFGDISGDHANDAAGICCNVFVDAFNDVTEALLEKHEIKYSYSTDGGLIVGGEHYGTDAGWNLSCILERV